MKLRVAIPAALAACLLVAPAVGARGPVQAPSQAQIRAAVRHAERSSQLWSTLNICNTPSHPDTVGIRGQMPALGFSSTLTMVFGVDYWSTAKKAFVAVAGVRTKISLGPARRGLHQDGATFTFAPHAGLLRGRVTFVWRRGRTVLGRVTRATRKGHPDADFGDPTGFSSGNCVIP